MKKFQKNIILSNLSFFSNAYIALLILILVTFIGIIGFMTLEGHTFIDAFYQTIITMSTVGFGEVTPFSEETKIFVSFLIITSLGTFAYAISTITSHFVSGDYKKYYKDYKAMKKIDDLSNHTIICGYGKVGKQTLATIEFHKKDFVVIESNPEIIKEIKKNNTFNIIEGDASKDEVLIAAGIKKAKSLIAVLPSDADNLFVVLTAKALNSNLNIISRASIESSVNKLKIAGADNVVMPDILGGNHMAQLVSTPDIVEFLNQINIQGSNEVNLEEIGFKNIPDNCKYKTIKDVKNQFENCNIIGYKSPENEYFINPSDTTSILPKSKIFVLGTSQQIKELNLALQLISD